MHVDGNRRWGGGQEQSLGLALALAARGEETHFIAHSESALSARLKGTYLSFEAMPLRGMAGALSVRRLARRLGELGPEIVHIHDSASQAAAALAARLGGGMRLVVTRRTAFPLSGGWLGRLKYEWCDRIICVSEAVRRECLAAGLPEARLAVVGDFVDCNYFRPGAVAEEETERRPTIGVVGRLSREKGHEVLLRAMRRVVGRVAEARLLIAGEGPEQGRLQGMAAALGLSDHVEFMGFVPDARSVVAASEVLAMPSLSEGLGVAALEAMALAKPVVASDAGGLVESVVDGETGRVVRAGDAEALADALVEMLEFPERAREMGRAGRERALERFDKPKIVDRILSLYDEVVNEGRR